MILRWIVAIVLIGHGIGHVMGFLAAWTSMPMGFTDKPWIFGGAVAVSSTIGKAFGLLWLVAMAGFVAAGLGLLLGQPWWPALAVIAAVLSLAVLLPWWNTVTPGSRLAILVVDILVIVALVGPWKQGVIDALS